MPVEQLATVPILRVLSLGAGVQSTTVLLMALRGKFHEKLDCAIFADTGWEPKAVYNHLGWLTDQAAQGGIPIHQVTAGNLRQELLDGTAGRRMPKDPCAADCGERINRYTAADLPLDPAHSSVAEEPARQRNLFD